MIEEESRLSNIYFFSCPLHLSCFVPLTIFGVPLVAVLSPLSLYLSMAEDTNDIQLVEPVSLREKNFIHQEELKAMLKARNARLPDMKRQDAMDEALDDPILPPTQAYPEPPVTPPELLRTPPGLEPPLKPGSILQKFVEEVNVTKLLEPHGPSQPKRT